MKFCYKCGSKIKSEVTFCTACGAKQDVKVVDGQVVVEQENNSSEQRVQDNGSTARRRDFVGKTGKWLAVAVIVFAVLGGGFFLVKGLVNKFSNGDFISFSKPVIAYKNGDTYTMDDGEIVKIYDGKIGETYSYESREYIFFYALDHSKALVYLKKNNELLEVDEVMYYRLSYDGKCIALLNADGKLYHGPLTELEDLTEIADEVVGFAAFNDLNTLFVIDEDGHAVAIDKDGKGKDFNVSDVEEIKTDGKRFLGYLKDEEFIVYDYQSDEEIFKIRSEYGSFISEEFYNVDEDACIVRSEDKVYYISADDGEAEEIAENIYYVYLSDSSGYKDIHVLQGAVNDQNPIICLVGFEGKYRLLNNKTADLIEGRLLSDHTKIALLDRDELHIIDRKTFKTEYSFDLDLDIEKQFVYKAIIYDKDQVLLITNEASYYLNGDDVVELDIDMKKAVRYTEHLEEHIVETIIRGDQDINCYVMSKDEIFSIDRDKVETIYEDDDIIEVHKVSTKGQGGEIVFLTDRDDLYAIQGNEVNLIAEDIKMLRSDSNLVHGGVYYNVDEILYFYSNGKSFEIGENFTTD